MHASYLLTALFACSTLASDAAANAFKKGEKVVERRNAEKLQPVAPVHDRLQKRASPFLNNATQSKLSC